MKRALLSFVFVFLAAFVVVFGSPGTAEAAIPGRGTWYGYFNNLLDTDGNDLFAGGIGATDINTFVAFYQTRLNSGNPTLAIPAAFTILNMLGAPAGTPWTSAQARFNEWNSAVRWYDANGRISWIFGYAYNDNTYLQDSVPRDVAWYFDSGNGSLPSIVFWNPDGSAYAIKRDCGNPVGQMGRLHVPTVVSCGSMSTSAAEPIAGSTSMQVFGRVNYISGPPGGPAIGPNSVSVSPNPGGVGSSASLSGSTVTVSSAAFTPTTAGTHTVTYSVWVNDALATCTGTFTVYPPTDIQCVTPNVDPSQAEINTPITITAAPTFSGGPPTVTYGNVSMTVSPKPGALSLQPTIRSANTIIIKSNPFTETSAGDFTISYTLRVNEKTVTCNGGLSPYSFTALQHPYFTVVGGDVTAGAAFGTGATPCGAGTSPNKNAGIASWNADAPGYNGAGTQYAAMAMNTILGFSDNMGNANGHGPVSLAFGNDNGSVTNPTGDLFGGLFGGPSGTGGVSTCIDYWQKKPTGLSPPPNLDTPGSGTYFVPAASAPYTLNGTINLKNGSQRTVYVDGDVIIKGDIKYLSTNWGAISQIPNLTIIAHGRIFIDNSVSTLTGTFIAIPDNPSASNSFVTPTKGTIMTCSNGSAPYDPTSVGGGNGLNAMIGDCGNQLTINGSLIGNQIFLLRTKGSVSTGQPAEVFNYNPASWLAPNPVGSSLSSGANYKSISGLPPIF